MKKLSIIFLLLNVLISFGQPSDSLSSALMIDSLKNIGDTHVNNQQFEKAIEIYNKANKITIKTYGSYSKENIASLINIGWTTLYQMKKEGAIQTFNEVQSIADSLKNKNEFLYARVNSSVAFFYRQIDNQKKADYLFTLVKPIYEKHKINNKKEYKKFLLFSGYFYERIGAYKKAESNYLFLLKDKKENPDNNLLDYQHYYNRLIGLYEKSNELNKKQKLQAEIKGALKKYSIDKSVEEHGYKLFKLADLYNQIGDFKNAELYFLMIEKIDTNKFDNKFILFELSGELAKFYEKNKKYKKSAYYFEQQIKKYNKVGKNKSYIPYMIQIKLANIYYKTNEFDRALSTILDSKEYWLQKLGKYSSLYYSCLDLMVKIYSKTNNYNRLKPLIKEIFELKKHEINNAFGFLSEDEKQGMFSKTKFSINQIQSAIYSINSGEFSDLQFNISLLIKGMMLQGEINTNKFIYSQTDSTIINSFIQLKKTKDELAKQLTSPRNNKKEIGSLSLKKENLEKYLARKSELFRSNLKTSKITSKDIKSQLQNGEIAIEFAHFEYKNPDFSDSIFYVASIVSPKWKNAKYVQLFEEKQLDKLLKNNGNRRLDYVDNLYTFSNRGFSPNNKKTKGLFQLIWQPLDSILQNVKTIYFSPSGLLNRINLGAISINEDSIISDKYKLFELSSTRLLVQKKIQLKNDKYDALIFGDIDFNIDSSIIKSRNKTVKPKIKEGDFFRYVSRSNKTKKWKNLKWTKKESESINKTLINNSVTSSLVNKKQATEEFFKSIGNKYKSPKILHLATHGFFFPDIKTTEADKGNIYKIVENPMLRSGLILSGANYAWEGNILPVDMEDGILTAYEISQMNLTNTELVVLSACETGLGDIKGNEGVYGLQRAFKTAGAKYLIMSLWQVPDFQTQDLMVTFYRKWLEEKMNITNAFYSAQQEMREKYQNPYFWAGFVLIE